MMEQRSAERWPTRTPAVEYDRVRMVELDAADRDRRRRRWRRTVPAVLALLVWGVVYMLQGIWKVGQKPAAFAAVPSVAAWVGLLGLYPGYGLNQPEELRRGSYAVLSAVAAVAVFAWAFWVRGSLPRVQLTVSFLGLPLLAPVARHLIKGTMKRVGLWGKPVMVIGSKGVGGRVAELLEREWALGYDPVAVFDRDPAAEAAPERATRGSPSPRRRRWPASEGWRW